MTVKQDSSGTARSKPSQRLNPFLDARREWNERFGEYVSAKRMWQSVALISLVMAGSTMLYAMYLSSQTKVVPYIVEVNKLGQVAYNGPLESTTTYDKRIVQLLIADFIENFRGVSADAVVQRSMVDKLYAYLAKSDPATRTISEYFQQPGNSPFEKAQQETVSVSVQTVLPVSDRSYQIEWTETTYNRDGTTQATNYFRGEVQIALAAHPDPKTILVNPLGLYITNISYAGYIK